VSSGPSASRAGVGLLGGAALIGGLTLLSRVAGLGRVVVFSQTVGTNCLGDVYTAANTLPNIVFEVVAGGILASAVVPLLAGDLSGNVEETQRARRTASALLTWVVIGLVPVAIVVAVLARQIAVVSLGSHAATRCPGSVDVAAAMLRVFAPQIVLYGIGIVLTGILQAHRRFAGPAIAPLLSSSVVIAAYLTYATLAGTARPDDLRGLPLLHQLVLSVGTTLGVVALTLPLFAWLRPQGFRLRPRLRFDPGVRGRALRLGSAGLGVLLGQQAAVFVALRLALDRTPPGFNAAYLYSQTVFLLPWALFAVPVATAVFPTLSASWSRGDHSEFAGRLAAAIRAVTLLSLLGAAALVAAAPHIATVFLAHTQVAPDTLAAGIIGFAPGLVGYSFVALFTRVLYAGHHTKVVTIAGVTGWLVVIGADVFLSRALPTTSRVAALAWGNTVGMTIAGALLLTVAARLVPKGSFDRLGRTVAVGVPAAVLSGGAGALVAAVSSSSNRLVALTFTVVVVTVVAVVFGGVLLAGLPTEARALGGLLRRLTARTKVVH
jgi:putative peptidoglycan lipid II flippase